MAGLTGMPLPELNTQLHHLYHDGCCALHDLSGPPLGDGDLPDQLTDMIQQVWKDKGLPEGTINKNVTDAFATKLWGGITNGFGKGSGGIDYDTPDDKMLESLLKNTWQFAAAKNYTQLRQMTDALIGDDGKLRSFNDFKIAAQAINDEHIGYLKTEYNLAIAGGQMASKWVEFEDSGASLLQFDVVMDAQTTDICRPLNGVIVSMDDPMLDIYYPPNHFNCRTTMRALNSGKPTPHTEIQHPDIPPMFRTNLAKQGLAFPLDHPYFKDAPKEVLQEALKLMPYEAQFNKLQKGLKQHALVDENSKDYNTVKLIGKEKANAGNKVDILPTLENAAHRKIILPDAKPNKSPDLRINGALHEIKEVKSTGNINSIKHAIDNASKQADNVIVKLNENVDDAILSRIAKSRFIDHKQLQKIEFRKSDGSYKIFNK